MKYVKITPFIGVLLFMAVLGSAQAAQKRLITVQDVVTIKKVSAPQLSPDGMWVAYTVKESDLEKDKSLSTLWMVRWDGGPEIQLTYSPHSVSAPKWSPDGRSITFMSSRAGEAKGAQVWQLDLSGGEAHQLTHVKKELGGYSWSPDGKRLALVLREPEDNEGKPIVITRYQFKGDDEGYYNQTHHWKIHLLDIKTGKLEALTSGDDYPEDNPTWSPDGKQIAFVTSREKEWDRSENADIWVTEARAGAPLRQLTTFKGWDAGPLSWNPDGQKIAYNQGAEPKYSLYGLKQVAVVSLADGKITLPTSMLDRDTKNPHFSADGKWIDFIVVDDRLRYAARVRAGGGKIKKLYRQKGVTTKKSSIGNRMVVLHGKDDRRREIYALEKGKLRQLSHQNDALFKEVKLGQVKDISFASSDGTEIHGLMTLPPFYEKGRKYPTLLWIHGGPYGQDEHAFGHERQVFAANGYVVVQVNYRGSSGRGKAFGHSIFADWGNHDLADVLAGMDYAVKIGVADPDRLGVGGWSQGGIITNYVIAHDTRMKAAISGAGAGNQLALYGSDWYVFVYDHEFKPPWEDPDLWIRLSAPFFHADRIRTPTLYVGGEKDFNVPIIGGEQMYQALRSLNVPSELVIYPGQHHSFSSPLFKQDLLERYLKWYEKYLK